jgi:hypothetical protein
MSRSRRQKRTHDGLTCVAVNGLLDSMEAAMIAATCKTLRSAFWDTPSVAEHVWAKLCFRGPFPFGVRSCGTALGHSGRMMVPALLEAAVQKQGSVVRTLRINDCLFNDSALCAVLRNCTNVTNLNVGQSDHRYLLNQPVFSSVLTSGSLVNLRHCHSLVTLQLQHTFVSVICCYHCYTSRASQISC